MYAPNCFSATDRNGKTTDFSYDPRGNVLTKTDPQLDAQTPRYLTQFTYDAKNNLTQVTDARGFVHAMTYDPTTNVLLSQSGQIDGSTSAVTKYEYADAANPGHREPNPSRAGCDQLLRSCLGRKQFRRRTGRG